MERRYIFKWWSLLIWELLAMAGGQLGNTKTDIEP